MVSKVENQNKFQRLLSILSGTLVAIATTLIMILLFALLIRFFDINDKVIFPINQVIKVLSLVVGTIVILKKHREKGFLKGILLGLVYFILSYLIFSILQGDFNFGLNNLLDLILTCLMGGIIGIIIVNIGRK